MDHEAALTLLASACFCLLVMMWVGASCGWRKGARYFGMRRGDGKKRWMNALEAIQGGRLDCPRGSLPSRGGLELVLKSEREVGRGIREYHDVD